MRKRGEYGRDQRHDNRGNPPKEDSSGSQSRSAHGKRRAADKEERAGQIRRRCAPLSETNLRQREFVIGGRRKRQHENRNRIRCNDAAFRSLVAASRYPIADVAIFAGTCLRCRHETCLDGISRIARQSGLLGLAMRDADEPIRQHQQRQDLFSPIHALTNTQSEKVSQFISRCAP